MREHEKTGILPELQYNIEGLEKNGIISSSASDIRVPSDFAHEALICVPFGGHFFCDRGFLVRQKESDQYLLLCVEQGILNVRMGGARTELRSGDILILDCERPYSLSSDEGTAFRHIYFHRGSSAAYIDLLTDGKGIRVYPSRSVELQSAVQSVIALLSEKNGNEHRVSAQMYRILAELAAEKEHGSTIRNAAVVQAIAFMEVHFSESLTIEQIATHVGLSEFYFSRLFRRCTSMSPHAYLVKLRITRARQLLAASHKSVERVAEECGFHSTTNFIRSFRENCGCTPKQYRRSLAADPTNE